MAQPGSTRVRTGARIARQAAAIGMALVVWHLFALGPGKAAGVPTPWRTLTTALQMAGTGDFWTAVGNTLITANVGLLLSVLVGVPLGLINGSSRKVGLSSQFVGLALIIAANDIELILAGGFFVAIGMAMISSTTFAASGLMVMGSPS